MTRSKAVLSVVAISAVVAGLAAIVLRLPILKPRLTTIQGAVIRSDTDPSKQSPLAGAAVTASAGDASATAHSDASGHFSITFPKVIWPGETVTLKFTHPEYHPLSVPLKMEFRSSARRLIVAALKPESVPVQAPQGKTTAVENVRIRYTVNSETSENAGSAVRMFQVASQGDMPCRNQGPCSPDGNWKAATTSIALDAGPGNEFRNVRASCIAGPCPFTRVDTSGSDGGGRTIVASALAWAGTATFLLQAEVFHTSIVSNVRESYPVIFDRTLSFTLPGSAEGVTIEAEIDKTPTVFPLGPNLYLDWATCTSRDSQENGSLVYQCQLRPNYRF